MSDLEGAHEIAKGGETKVDNPTYKEARRLFFDSFRFSQGESELQDDIFVYLHDAHPDWQITPEITQRIREGLLPIMKDRVLIQNDAEAGPFHGSYKGDIEDFFEQFNLALSGFVRIVNTGELRHAGPLRRKVPVVDRISKLILKQDKQFLVKRQGRARIVEGNEVKYNPDSDPWLSQLIYYGFEGNSTGSPDFDQMFADVKNWYLQNAVGDRTRAGRKRVSALQQVANIYYTNHPQLEMPTELQTIITQ